METVTADGVSNKGKPPSLKPSNVKSGSAVKKQTKKKKKKKERERCPPACSRMRCCDGQWLFGERWTWISNLQTAATSSESSGQSGSPSQSQASGMQVSLLWRQWNSPTSHKMASEVAAVWEEKRRKRKKKRKREREEMQHEGNGHDRGGLVLRLFCNAGHQSWVETEREERMDQVARRRNVCCV